jgi:hypothetical protein
MLVECYGEEFDIPDLLIDQFLKDFDGLPGGKHREGVLQIRSSIDEILDIVAEDPELLYEKEYLDDFLRALAMKQAMGELGILYDS